MTESAAPKLVARGLTKRFGTVTALDDISFEVPDRSFVVLVGPSGCGKSTLLRLIAGLEKITEGDLTLDGERINDVAAAQRGLAMVFQSYALYPHMTVAQNMSVGLRIAKAPKAEIEEKVEQAARILELDKLLDRKPRALSGGQRQRVAIGRAIVRNPKVFLFDEPLSNLDAALRLNMRLEIARLHRQLHATMIYVTHDQVEAMTLADQIIVMNAGRIEQIGRPLELYERPVNAFVAGFLGSPRINMLPGRIGASGRVILDCGPELVVPATDGHTSGAQVTLGIRPENLRLADDPELLESSPLILDARIDVIERLGAQTVIYGLLADNTPITIVTDQKTTSRPGDPVSGTVVSDTVLAFDQNGDRLT